VATPSRPDFGKAFESLDRLSDISILVVPGVESDTATEASSYVSGRAARPGVGGDMVYVMDPPPGGEWSFGQRDSRNSAEQIAATHQVLSDVLAQGHVHIAVLPVGRDPRSVLEGQRCHAVSRRHRA